MKLNKLKLNKPEIIGIIVAVIIAILSLIFLRENDIFYFILGIALTIGVFPFIVALILNTNSAREKEEMFLEFSRNLVGNVRTGTPISKSILNLRKKDYGKLNPYIDKLANQISLGIPVSTSLKTFARDIGNSTITRAVMIISEAEKAGGKIDDILDAVVKSVSQTEILKKERRAAMYTLVVQGYIIFMIFIVITLVMQFKILPIAVGLGDGASQGSALSGINLGGASSGPTATVDELTRPFLWLLITQGFFTGLVIGKLSEGKVKFGIKHSFILTMFAILIGTGARVFVG